ncbi:MULTISPECIES: hypothetical protein [unclassified Phycicoccus]|jgi:hypothetical protein|uniref:hypothetical protein n=1 Tax=unclassified Phycicoccus TaxID=2637926 RepID=UPI000702624B|nr:MULTISPECIES: hypothetical protein [unclassified Phycicoccus]KQU70794.1 hypothetical protein ASC58_03195 [Phycicoccus sp. Root101]KQZ89088.1 hypothetical protein ASD62_06995 [Phycicoccus sp. Root563]
MENITMTIDATHMSRVRSVCPEAGRQLLVSTRGWVSQFQGIAVPASVAVRANADVQAPVGYIGGFDATPSTKDLAFRPFGEPPV